MLGHQSGNSLKCSRSPSSKALHRRIWYDYPVNYLRSPAAGERRLPDSRGVASLVVDLRPNFFGLTLL